jgi:acyl carrier protein
MKTIHESLQSAQSIAAAISDRIVALLASKLGCGPEFIDDYPRRFETYGLASIDAIDVMCDLEDFLNLELSPTLLNDFPTVADLTAQLASMVRAR